LKKFKLLTLNDRRKIEELLHQGLPKKEICLRLGIWESTIYREFKKCEGKYNAQEAHHNTNVSKNLIDWEIIGKRFGIVEMTNNLNLCR